MNVEEAREAAKATAAARVMIDTQADLERLAYAKAALDTRPLSQRDLDAVRVGYYTAAIQHRSALIGHAEGIRSAVALVQHDTFAVCWHCTVLWAADKLDDLIAQLRRNTTGDPTP